jgi:glycosyltransferase involved in cell wall biosynthesis
MISSPAMCARLPRLLVNCTNLHVGGGVAVASSFVNILSRQPDPRLEISLLLSSSVHANLLSLGADLSGFAHCEVVDYYGLLSLWQGLGRRFAGFDVVFTVFGPAYTIAKGRRHVCGFAQAHVLYPRNPVEQRMRLGARVLKRLKYIVYEIFFARADELVVELEHVKVALTRKHLFRNTPIHIVYNTVDAVFTEPARWAPLSFPPTPPALRLGVVSRNYLHKNLACLPAVQRQLQQVHGLAVVFFVTFTDAEWQACDEDFRRAIHNVGALVLPQCPSFYSAMDGIIFPSLLECFSAVPLEAMTMRKPLFASDLPFIRDCCHEHAQYFDPLDVASIARCIAGYYQEQPEAQRQDQLQRAEAFVQRYPSPAERARSYLDIVLAAAQLTHA